MPKINKTKAKQFSLAFKKATNAATAEEKQELKKLEQARLRQQLRNQARRGR